MHKNSAFHSLNADFSQCLTYTLFSLSPLPLTSSHPQSFHTLLTNRAGACALPGLEQNMGSGYQFQDGSHSRVFMRIYPSIADFLVSDDITAINHCFMRILSTRDHLIITQLFSCYQQEMHRFKALYCHTNPLRGWPRWFEKFKREKLLP